MNGTDRLCRAGYCYNAVCRTKDMICSDLGERPPPQEFLCGVGGCANEIATTGNAEALALVHRVYHTLESACTACFGVRPPPIVDRVTIMQCLCTRCSAISVIELDRPRHSRKPVWTDQVHWGYSHSSARCTPDDSGQFDGYRRMGYLIDGAIC